MGEGAVHRLHLAPSKRFPSWSSKKFLLEIINTHKNYALKREEKNKSNTEKERKETPTTRPVPGIKARCHLEALGQKYSPVSLAKPLP